MGRKKTYVLDTTVLIDNPDVIYELGANEIVIPGAVIREIDGLKRNDRPAVAEAARKVARELDRLGSRGDLRKGVELVTTGTLRITTGYDHIDELDSEGDNRVVGTAVKLVREGKDVELLTTDANMRTVARVHGVKANSLLNWGSDKVTADNDLKELWASAERTAPSKGSHGARSRVIDKRYIIPLTLGALIIGAIIAVYAHTFSEWIYLSGIVVTIFAGIYTAIYDQFTASVDVLLDPKGNIQDYSYEPRGRSGGDAWSDSDSFTSGISD